MRERGVWGLGFVIDDGGFGEFDADVDAGFHGVTAFVDGADGDDGGLAFFGGDDDGLLSADVLVFFHVSEDTAAVSFDDKRGHHAVPSDRNFLVKDDLAA